MAVLLSRWTDFALATLPTAADEAGGPPSIKFYELRDNLCLRPAQLQRVWLRLRVHVPVRQLHVWQHARARVPITDRHLLRRRQRGMRGLLTRCRVGPLMPFTPVPSRARIATSFRAHAGKASGAWSHGRRSQLSSRTIAAALPVAFALVLLPLSALAVAAQSQTEWDSHGQVSAEFYYEHGGERFESRDLWLAIDRGDQTLHDEAVSVSGCAEPWCWPGGFGQRPSVRVRDLDADGEPEVLLDLFSGGAHCC